jgi:hypothetical protein
MRKQREHEKGYPYEVYKFHVVTRVTVSLTSMLSLSREGLPAASECEEGWTRAVSPEAQKHPTNISSFSTTGVSTNPLTLYAIFLWPLFALSLEAAHIASSILL